MPELPDLHVFSLNLKKRVLDKPIVEATVLNPNRVTAAGAFESALRGAAIADIERVGKELFFHLSNQKAFSVHLMLNGQFHLCRAEDAAAIRYRAFTATFADGEALSVSDFGNRCKVTLNPRKGDVPDVMSEAFDRAYFARVARYNPALNVKAFLIDQKIMKGIGNAYADEILWKANISPEVFVGRIPQDALAELHAAIGDVLRDAIENILRISPDSISGEERSFLRVHNPKRTLSEDGEPIIVKQIADKKTYYTKKQRVFR